MITAETLLAQQADLRRRLDALETSQHYQREETRQERHANEQAVAALDEDRFQQALAYQRQTGAAWEDVEDAFGSFSDRPPKLWPDGTVGEFAPGSVHYAKEQDDDIESLMESARHLDELTQLQMAYLRKLLEERVHLTVDGKLDFARSYAVATAWHEDPEAERRRQGRPSPQDKGASTETPARHLTVAGQSAGSNSGDGFFSPSPDPWGRTVAATAPTGQTDFPAFKKDSVSGRKPQAVTKPMTGRHAGLPPADAHLIASPYERQREEPMTEAKLEQVLSHMRKHSCSFETAQHYIEERERLKMAKAMGAHVDGQVPADAPVGHPAAAHAR